MLLAFIAIFVFIFLIVYGITSDKKEWNNGVCSTCNTNWVCFDLDSSGARGYKCKCGEFHSTWISYNVDKVPKKKL